MTIEKLTKEITELNAKLVPLRTNLRKLETDKCIKDAKKKIGKCFVFRNNSFSCPEKESDYWDTYMKVIGIEEEEAICFEISKDSHGNISFEVRRYYISPGAFRPGWEVVSEVEYLKHLQLLLNECPELEVKTK